MIGPGVAPLDPGSFRPGPRRADDRRVAVASVVIAAGFLLVAAAAALARATGTEAIPFWLPLHLALAGGASGVTAAPETTTLRNGLQPLGASRRRFPPWDHGTPAPYRRPLTRGLSILPWAGGTQCTSRQARRARRM